MPQLGSHGGGVMQPLLMWLLTSQQLPPPLQTGWTVWTQVVPTQTSADAVPIRPGTTVGANETVNGVTAIMLPTASWASRFLMFPLSGSGL